MLTAEQIDRALVVARHRLREHQLNLAEIELRPVLDQAPNHAEAQRLLGITLAKLGRGGEATAALRTAIEAAPDNVPARFDLAVTLRDLGQAAEAEAVWRDAVALAGPGHIAGPEVPLAERVFTTDPGRYRYKVVDYDYQLELRWGGGRPAHPELHALIAAGDARYGAFLDRLGELAPTFEDVRFGGDYDAAAPFWLNTWFAPLDALALTEMLRRHDPARFLEIGSGLSTKFARRAIGRHGLRTRITSIDPEPRSAVDAICDRVIRAGLEACDPAEFAALEPGEILFLDSSHRSFQNSDVTVFFLEILPRLKPGVIVHIHDIYLPWDYTAGQVPRLWNEQYLLATALLFGPDRFEILFPCWHVTQDRALAARLNAAVRRGRLEGLSIHGFSFWMTVR